MKISIGKPRFERYLWGETLAVTDLWFWTCKYSAMWIWTLGTIITFYHFIIFFVGLTLVSQMALKGNILFIDRFWESSVFLRKHKLTIFSFLWEMGLSTVETKLKLCKF